MILNYRGDCVIQSSTDTLSRNHTLHYQYTVQM